MNKKAITKDELIDFFIDKGWYVYDEDEDDISEKVNLKLEFMGEIGESYSFSLDCERTLDAIHQALHTQYVDFDVDWCVWEWIDEGKAEVSTMVDDAREIEVNLKKIVKSLKDL